MNTQNANIAYDFSDKNVTAQLSEGQPLAIMPAYLAKKLLQLYEKSLVNASSDDIISQHIHELRKCTTVDQSVELSLVYIQERQLIADVAAGNWSIYEVIAGNWSIYDVIAEVAAVH